MVEVDIKGDFDEDSERVSRSQKALVLEEYIYYQEQECHYRH